MPELPEVETTRRGITPHLLGQTIKSIVVRQPKLRWPIPGVISTLKRLKIKSIKRRGKYLLFETSKGTLIVHLGMSGSLRIVNETTPVEKHDHVDLCVSSGVILRYTDPRRFGAWLWTEDDPLTHKLIASLGPEPLTDEFNVEHLVALAKGRKIAVKTFIMNSHVVVGVGNIYANEALFQAGIHPERAAGRISKKRYAVLVTCIKTVLTRAVEQGGTTLKDFVGGDGKPGYFQQSLQVYGRQGEACCQCGNALSELRLNQRATVFCTVCQS